MFRLREMGRAHGARRAPLPRVLQGSATCSYVGQVLMRAACSARCGAGAVRGSGPAVDTLRTVPRHDSADRLGRERA